MNNNVQLVWDPGFKEEPAILNLFLNHLTENKHDLIYSYCEEKSIIVFNLKIHDIITLLQTKTFAKIFAFSNTVYFMVFDDRLLAKLEISNRRNYVSMHFMVYGLLVSDVHEFNKNIDIIFYDFIESKDILHISWYTYNHHGSNSYDIDEIYNDTIHSEAYPYILDFDQYIQDYMNSDEQVLILLGTPGTGKSRLIRYILYRLSLAYASTEDNHILYTNDQKSLEEDDIYMDFMTRGCIALVAEDVDHHLKDRKDGSNAIYRILNAADGLVRGHNQKILLSTNIPSAKEIDEALIRPGRCYDVITTRKLNATESLALLNKIDLNHSISLNTIKPDAKYTVAEIYNMLKKHKKTKM